MAGRPHEREEAVDTARRHPVDAFEHASRRQKRHLVAHRRHRGVRVQKRDAPRALACPPHVGDIVAVVYHRHFVRSRRARLEPIQPAAPRRLQQRFPYGPHSP